MILALRQRHRRMFAVIGVLLPIAFAAGIAARKPVPTMAVLPAELDHELQSAGTTSWERVDLFNSTVVKVRLLRNANGGLAIKFTADQNFVKPDLIVYWVAGSPKVTDSVPENAVLLGAFGMTVLSLPPNAARSEGSLILFSLADNELVEVSKSFVAADVRRRTVRANASAEKLHVVPSAATEK